MTERPLVICFACEKPIPRKYNKNGKIKCHTHPKMKGKSRSRCQQIRDNIRYKNKNRDIKAYTKPESMKNSRGETDKEKLEARNCLRCGQDFMSHSKFNRVCRPCSTSRELPVKAGHKMKMSGRTYYRGGEII